MKAELHVDVLEPSEFAAWDRLVASSSQGSPYAMATYLAALSEATGATFRVVAARRGDDLIGGVALFEQTRADGRHVAPRPLLYYTGCVLKDFGTRYPSEQTARTLEVTAALGAFVAACGFRAVTLKHRSTFVDARAFMADGWTVRPGYTYVVPIANLEEAWQRVEQNLRRLIKRCTQDGLVITDDADVETFLRLHHETTTRKGLPAYLPADRFAVFIERLRQAGLCRLYHARLPDGTGVSTQLVLVGCGPVAHTVCAATAPEHLRSGATAFLRWKVFESLNSLGFEANDLTDAALNSVSHFKSQLGGTLELLLICERTAKPSGLGARMRASLAALRER
ncbi:MAG TPA: GNAT family N-acetyltransferase [Caldimonas sp.]|nr:GNAT family N-acetyltransferase [Caldimonas sp.]